MLKQQKNPIFFSIIFLLYLIASINQINLYSVQAAPNDSEKLQHVQELLKKGMAEPGSNPVVGIGRGTDYAKVTLEAVENAGGLNTIIKKGDMVLIKPNICSFMGAAGTPVITDYRTVQAIVKLVAELGASKIVIAEGTIIGNAFDSSALKVNKYDTIQGVELVNFNAFNREDCYRLKPQKSLTGAELFIPKIFMDADVVINIAKLKTHHLTVASLSLKNSFGVPPGNIYGGGGYKSGLHLLGINEAIIDLNRIRKPDFAVIEGIVGGEGYGPLYNTPVKSNIIFAGKDLAALDMVALTFMGFKIDQVPHVALAGKEGLGVTDLEKIKIIGVNLNTIKMKFNL